VRILSPALLLAALVLQLLGYTVVMTLMLGAILFFVSKRKLWMAALVAVGAALASRLVFEVWLGTALPTASIDFLAGLGL
jgi:nicotinamide riboside transporter PnuC